MSREERLRIICMMGVCALLLGRFCFASPVEEENSELVRKAAAATVMVLVHDEKSSRQSQASGFFISSDGEVITNDHVMAGISRASIKTSDGGIFAVSRVVARDVRSDLVRLAIRMPPNSVTPLQVSSTPAQQGDAVLIIGNPAGEEGVVSRGTILSLPSVPGFGHLLQISAAIKAGSSGSPLLNSEGEVIGVAAFQFSSGQGYNFAIPAAKILAMPAVDEPLAAFQEKGETGQTDEEMFQQGKKAMEDKQYQQALALFTAILTKHATIGGNLWRGWEVWFYAGTCQGRLDMHREAASSFRQAISLMPDISLSHYSLGVAYSHLDLLPEAKNAYEQAVRLQPDFAEAHFNLGLTCWLLRDVACFMSSSRILNNLEPALARRLAASLPGREEMEAGEQPPRE
ncbi:MAG: trypsin-like peptidase domain-containing protein [Deltaproteobacteria bacterium]|nr:trypsin-like peptidase domain-containing protein [Deltaproteobacteria bacterium]